MRRRRSVRDAVAIAVLCLAAYGAASWLGLSDHLYTLARRYWSDEIGDLIAVIVVLGFLMLIYTARRAQDFKREVRSLHEAEGKAADIALQLTAALNNISQGISMFDSAERLVICNSQYLQMYGLSPAIVKPGIALSEVVRQRFESGKLREQPEEYYSKIRESLAKRQAFDTAITTTDGREILIANYPIAKGGWVATHDDRTETRRRDESFRLLFDTNPVAMCVFACDDLRFLAVNDAALVQYGYSREHFLTLKLTDIRIGREADIYAYMRTLPDTHNSLSEHRLADGRHIHVSVQSRVLNYENKRARLVALNDVTARKLAEDELRRAKMFLDTVIDNVPQPIVVKTLKDGRFMLINKASEELHGYKREDTIGKTLHDVFSNERADLIAAQDRECIYVGQPIVIRDHTIATPRGDRLVTSKKAILPGIDGKPEYLLTLIDDVTVQRKVAQRIAHMAHSDPLTDLPNRAAFNKCLDTTLEMAKAERRSFAVLCLDLDRFKEVNDLYGHAVGDALLCQVADRLRAAADTAFIARLGGDEFTIIADNDKRSNIMTLVDRLTAAFVEDFDVDGNRLVQALSIGVAIYPDHGADVKTLLNNADAALYRAKAEGSGGVRFFKAAMGTRLRERAAMQSDLKSAVSHNEIRLHYQPQFQMTGEVTGFEALSRWNSPKRGMVPPSEFIPLAEESSLILQLGEWVMREACREAASWENPLNISVNVSPVQFRHGDLPAMVHSVLLETGLSPGRLEIEITEGVLIDDSSRALSILRRLKTLGVKIALDDFGRGYSSLAYLRAFPFDKIKLDRSFISDIETNRHSIAIVHAVIGLGRSLDIQIVAEGVETKAQHALLAAEGCNQVQGYLTGPPLEIANYAGVVGKTDVAARLAHAV